MTKGEALDAYRTLQNLPPSDLTSAVVDDVVDAAQALEPVAREVQEKLDKHRERLGVNGEMTDEQEEELRSVMGELRAEECDINPPTVDATQMGSIAGMRQLQEIDALDPVLG